MNTKIPTARTNGIVVQYNPDYMVSLSFKERMFVVAHEVMHNVLNTNWRRRPEWPEEVIQIAADLEINCILRECDFKSPNGCLFPEPLGFPPNLAMEDYAELLLQQQQLQQSGEAKEKDGPASNNEFASANSEDDKAKEKNQGQDQGQDQAKSSESLPGSIDPGKCGSYYQPTKEELEEAKSSLSQLALDWASAAAEEAERSSQRGNLPGSIARLAKEELRPPVDWREQLDEFIKDKCKGDYSWTPPDRRAISRDLYLPSIQSDWLLDIIWMIDVSGSVDAEKMAVFQGAMLMALEQIPCTMHIVYHDCKVQKVQEWHPDDGELKLESPGGGGTSHVPAFQLAHERWPDADCIVCLTDGYTEFPPSSSVKIPTLWAIVNGDNDAKIPFGKKITLTKK
jgi:predicted metal-dependent peptidase